MSKARQKLAHDFFYVALFAIDCVVQFSHLIVRDRSGETVDCITEPGVAIEGLASDNSRSFVRREIMTVIFELIEAELVDKPVSRVAGDQINLPVGERLVTQR